MAAHLEEEFVRGASLWLAACAVALAACSETRLKRHVEEVVEEVVDDQLTITGTFCTSPAANVVFPVKVMFIVDGSGSQQFSDQNRQRVTAVEDVINALIGTGTTYFKIVVFNATVRSTPPPTADGPIFTNDINVLTPALTDLGEADTVTDYQGALAVAYNELLRDMSTTSENPDRGLAELGRTKYVVTMISDGLPDPQCQAGLGNDFNPMFPSGINRLCEDQAYLSCILEEPGTECGFGGGVCDDSCGSNVCTFEGTSCYRAEDASMMFGGINNVELAAGNDYNQPYQILQKVDDIMELQERFEVGEIRVHSGLVLDPNLDPVIADMFGDPAQAAPLMEEISKAGNGRYMEFYGGDEIDFLDINFASIKQQRVVRGFYAVNRAARLTEQGMVPDTDFDGLDDDLEFANGLSTTSPDTDGDGYSDFLEWTRRAFSFDAKDPCMPPVVDVPGGGVAGAACDPAALVNCAYSSIDSDPDTGELVKRFVDTDRDGLHDCEERQLGTDPMSPDTDRDGLPDRLDYVWGLDPLHWDYDRDDDQDGVANGLEVEWHLNPRVQQNDETTRDRYRYDRTEAQRTLDGRPCYDFRVRKVQLVYTPNSAKQVRESGAGYNEIRLYITENMADDVAGTPLVRTACIRPRYVPPSFKEPMDGQWQVDESEFKYLLGEDPLFNEIVELEQKDMIFDADSACTTSE